MSLKYWTTGILIFGMALILASPIVISSRPDVADVHASKLWVLQFGVFVTFTALVWVLVEALALLLIRRIRRDLTEERERNMNVLLEVSLRDHEKGAETGSESG